MVFLVNVGQSSDGRVSSVEPAALIHNIALQMARTVKRSAQSHTQNNNVSVRNNTGKKLRRERESGDGDYNV